MKTKLVLIVLMLTVAVMPGLAQQDTASEITIAGLTFSVDPAFAPGVNVIRYSESQLDTMPIAPPHTAITLYDGTATIPGLLESAGTIMIYEVAALSDGDDEYTRRYEALQALLEETPDLDTFMQPNMPGEDVEFTLPFLPVFPAAQVTRAQAEYVELDGLRGIRYVTVYAQAMYPFVADEFLMTFQGISDDGDHMVTAIFPISIDLFPAEPPAPDFDYDGFIGTFETYLAESIEAINTAEDTVFTPSLVTLDDIIGSFTIE